MPPRAGTLAFAGLSAFLVPTTSPPALSEAPIHYLCQALKNPYHAVSRALPLAGYSLWLDAL